jgi:hypothetical protein
VADGDADGDTGTGSTAPPGRVAVPVPGAVVFTLLKIFRNSWACCSVPLQSSESPPASGQALSRPTAQN